MLDSALFQLASTYLKAVGPTPAPPRILPTRATKVPRLPASDRRILWLGSLRPPLSLSASTEAGPVATPKAHKKHYQRCPYRCDEPHVLETPEDELAAISDAAISAEKQRGY